MQTAFHTSKVRFRNYEPYTPAGYQERKAAIKKRVANGSHAFGTLRLNAGDVYGARLIEVGLTKREATFATTLLLRIATLVLSRRFTPRNAPFPIRAPAGCREVGIDELAERIESCGTTLNKYLPFFKAAELLDYIPTRHGTVIRIYKVEKLRPFVRPSDTKTENEAWNCLRKILPKRKQSTANKGSSPNDDNRVVSKEILRSLTHPLVIKTPEKQEKQRTVSQNSYYGTFVFEKGETKGSPRYQAYAEHKRLTMITSLRKMGTEEKIADEWAKSVGRCPTEDC